ncbi:hypothetical protein L6164_031355 [Bauhinia variegata]|uniref:Uncharacterized protein n=1 Tax=Bauhinia variegata TaxID=167791 RepID=A0ACB9LFM9_BAUVA|nr:hypothetical protein L6164_031355 [Bauhinia variegata]
MWRLLAAVARNVQNMKKSSRVADENMFEGGNAAELPIFAREPAGRREHHGWNGFSVIYAVLHAPISMISCVSHPQVNGSDGVWVSGEFAQISEMNHLMVSDSMRYAILM